MSQGKEVDYEIMKTLNDLLQLELQDDGNAANFAEYRQKSKALLTKMLVKLEDNHEYQNYLELEVKRLEEDAASEEEKEGAWFQSVLDEKDLAINKLRRELEASKAAYAELQHVRAKEMQTVAVVCNALSERLHSLNINFNSEEDREGPTRLES